jgi:hypothetical protein
MVMDEYMAFEDAQGNGYKTPLECPKGCTGNFDIIYEAWVTVKPDGSPTGFNDFIKSPEPSQLKTVVCSECGAEAVKEEE